MYVRRCRHLDPYALITEGTCSVFLAPTFGVVQVQVPHRRLSPESRVAGSACPAKHSVDNSHLSTLDPASTFSILLQLHLLIFAIHTLHTVALVLIRPS